MEWICADKLLPGKDIDWVIVRCVNSDLCDFYFMANYCVVDGEWSYFDGDNVYEVSMRVTHWAIPDDVKEPDYFIKEDGTIITENNL